ncbi:response regulator transcription factor [Psychroserpens sp. AS72]|uniref:LytR/AlgR family response regulator transcription factor n=1 Tax=Psychroserpens sp. AS72 TaxID=3135775 RepID=UPI003181BF9A
MSFKNEHNLIRLYIVEDEPLIAETAKMSLESFGINVLGFSEDYENALKEIQQKQANIVLLDINLQGEKDGIDLALTLEKLNIPYLFVTSQTDPSTLARVKETNPLGFIVKPFTDSGLLSNVELAWHKISLEKEEYIIIRSEGERIKLNQASIQYLKAFDNYCYIVTVDKEYLLPHTLKHITEKLNSKIFVKSHRSYVVNIQKIKSIKSDKVIIENIEVPMSSTYKQQIEAFL